MYRMLILGLVALVGVGCSDSHNTIGAQQAHLTTFESCEALESHVKQIAIKEMEQTLDSYGNYNSKGGFAVSPNAPVEDNAGGPERDASSDSSGPDFSKTNTQEKDVDEADIVKTDGHFVYVLSGGFLTVIRSVYEADELQEVARIEIEGNPLEMFVHGIDPNRHDAASPTKAVVFSQVWGEGIPEPLLRDVPSNQSGACPEDGFGDCGYVYQNPVLKLTVLDLTDRAHPELELEVYSEGTYLSSRLVDHSVHAVMSSFVQGPELQLYPQLDFGTDGYYGSDGLTFNQKVQLAEEIRRLKAENRARINASSIEDWLPRSYRVEHTDEGNITTSGLIAACESFSKPETLDGRGIIDVFTLALGASTNSVEHSAIVSHSGVVYASTDSLYLATHPWYSGLWWGWDGMEDQNEVSFVHKFDLKSNPVRAVYVASGAIEGHVLNQFSMDEEDGRLRVATTTEARWVSENETELSKNHLFVLGQEGEELVVEGSVRNLAKGEQIYSARFEGNRGFIVTFRQVDPLFVFDLSEPQPVKLAELKIPGFSNYMHPLYDAEGNVTHLLTVGQGLSQTPQLPVCGKDALGDIEEGGVDGLQLSIFDVRDATNPCLIHTEFVGGYSEAQYNHKAFSYFAEHKLLALPVTQWGGEGEDFSVGLKVFRVDVETGIQHLSDIDHTASYDNSEEDYWNYDWWIQVQRSLTIEDHLYSISGRAVYATPLSALGHDPLVHTSSILLPDPEPMYWYGEDTLR